VRTLPDNPNLDHLRQQAKDLLSGLRDSDATVSLAGAQASLAKQYGFRSWTDLKAEVDRLGGHADVANPALARAIAERYALGEVTAPMRSTSRTNHMGRPYLLVTDRGRWAVRTMDNWIPIVDVEAEVTLQHAAAAAGVSLPAPVRSGSGAIVEEIDGHRWRCNGWLHSGPPLAAPVSAVHTHAAGGILATVHGLDLPVDRISPWHAQRLSTVPWVDLAVAAAARGAGWADALAHAAPTLVDLDAIGQGEPASAPVLCHNALGPGIVRLGPGGKLIVFDWEHAGGQPPSWELGDALLHWTVDPAGEVNAAGARALVEGYRAQAVQVPPLDLTAFSGAATSMANYVYGEVSRALAAGDDEERRHADRSVGHLLAHLPTCVTFERLLDVALAAI
jgi:aminoglycoside phosphotransferase (APT) family kinase protein